MNKIRLDNLLVTKGLIQSLEKAKALILEGLVLVNDVKADKAGTLVDSNSDLKILQTLPYVSRGGLKLEAALRDFNIDITGKTAMDVGASTGGFTDCLLQNHIKKVYAVDVGYGQFDWKLRNDPRVTVFEKTNIRYLSEILRGQACLPDRQGSGLPAGQAGGRCQELEDLVNHRIDIATVDVSFISLLKVIPKVIEFLKPDGEIIALIKPQFEASRKDVEKGGVIKNETKRAEIVNAIIKEVEKMGLEVKGVIKSPLTGPKGNVEFLIYLKLKQ